MQLIFATHNENKVREIKELLPDAIEIKSLSEIGDDVDIPETATTLEGNAEIKSSTIAAKFNVNCFADDTGLEVEALNGVPGVYSARYAGENANSTDNIDKLLKEMQGLSNRKAQFRTVISLILNGKKYLFEGLIKGEITEARQGSSGFGYDPVFKPKGYQQTFAEMSLDEKNKISHRAIAFQKLVEFIKSKS